MYRKPKIHDKGSNNADSILPRAKFLVPLIFVSTNVSYLKENSVRNFQVLSDSYESSYITTNIVGICPYIATPYIFTLEPAPRLDAYIFHLVYIASRLKNEFRNFQNLRNRTYSYFPWRLHLSFQIRVKITLHTNWDTFKTSEMASILKLSLSYSSSLPRMPHFCSQCLCKLKT